MGVSRTSDSKLLDGPAPLHTSPCAHRYSNRWWRECAVGAALWERCLQAGNASSAEWVANNCSSHGALPASYSAAWWGSELGHATWANCSLSGVGSTYWNQHQCATGRCCHPTHPCPPLSHFSPPHVLSLLSPSPLWGFPPPPPRHLQEGLIRAHVQEGLNRAPGRARRMGREENG